MAQDKSSRDDGVGQPMSAPSLSLPKGGGAIRGIGEKFAANPVTGTGSMSVPIAVSPGRSGFTPQLSLSYDSGAGNGPFGFGWSLSVPSISRKTDKGLPRYLDAIESDIFILSGAEDLVPMMVQVEHSGQWKHDSLERKIDDDAYRVDRYRPRIEGLFSRIERWTDVADATNVHWRSISKDNILTLYGKDADSRIADPEEPSRIFSWLICETRDAKGNAVIYKYKPEDGMGVDLRQAHERNRGERDDPRRAANRYLKRIYYGNRAPLLNTAGQRPPFVTDVQIQSALWMFEVAFDYGEHDADAPRSDDAGPWTYRDDPFSSYRAGFELRTTRLCQRVLMFHHFEDEPGVGSNCLVRSTDLTYSHEQDPANARNPVYTFLRAVTQTGYRRRNGGYEKRSLPPIEFEYTQPIVQDTIHDVDADSLENLPVGLDGTTYQWIDLHGEGIPGILTEQAGAWFYKRNLSLISDRPVGFAPLERVAAKPSVALTGGHAQFMDLAGDGQPDVVVVDGPTPGLFEHDGDEGWQPFRSFTSLLGRDTRDRNLKFVDLDGDGHADVLISEDDAFVWHASQGEGGFGPARRVAQALDDEKGPRLVFGDGTQSIYLADMSGDGLTDLVRIRNGEVCYWPHLGYGRFGAKVTMDHAALLDQQDQLDHERIRLADIDGSGTTDIIYLHRDGVRLYFNQSGNSWSPPQPLRVFPPIDNLAAITAIDLLGNGTACLVWSSPLPASARRQMRYVDLMGGQKPHLLVKTVNNLGAEIRTHYAPSTKFYLQDKRDGTPWISRLPFPVHVVERIETFDHISRNRFVTRYAYHHGCFDGEEREFRGFGMVEQWDTAELSALTGEGAFAEATNLDAVSDLPPVLTKTWFHTGIYIGRDHISDFFAGVGKGDGEYYREPALAGDDGDDQAAVALLLADTVMPEDLSAFEEREACRALKGSMLRQEVYALDGTDKAEHPYTVTEQDFTVRRIQPRADNRHAIFFTHPREAISYHYERNPEDPRISHALTLEVDPYGNVLKSLAIGYGRRQSPLPEQRDRDKQMATLITYTDNSVTEAVNDAMQQPDDYQAPLPAESRTYELTGCTPENNAARFTFEEWTRDGFALVVSAVEISYEQNADTTTRQKRLIEHARTRYRKDDLTALLALGKIEPLALPGEGYTLALTPGVLGVYASKSGIADLQTILHDEGGYVDLDADGRWWIPSGRVFYSPDPNDTPAQELAAARTHFFLPRRYQNPFGRTTSLNYDGPGDPELPRYDLLVTRTTDALGNLVQAQNNYRVLQASRVTDPNGNRSEAAFDTLGFVAGTAVMGKASPAAVEGDSLEDFEADLTAAQIEGFYAAEDPHALAPSLLKWATTRIIYDLDQFHRTQAAHPSDPTQWLPPYAATVARETHVSDPLPAAGLEIQISFSYSDGFGREIQKKIQAEAGPLVEEGPVVSPRWVGSGWTIFNNKGKPVRQYEPFFSQLAEKRHQFEFGIKVGVSPILFYDPVERVVATVHPNHTWEKVVFDPWRQETWDLNDTVIIDPRSDEDVKGFFVHPDGTPRVPETEYLPTWYGLRTDPAHEAEASERWPDPKIRNAEKDAADKSAVHASTPLIAHADSLGRAFLTIAHNTFRHSNTPPTDPPKKEFYETRVSLDIEGNQREVIDALDRIVMRYDYDMLGNRIHQASMEAGERWMLNDAMGKPIRAWDSRGFIHRITYDPLRRQTELFVMHDGVERLAERTAYGESQGAQKNHRTRVFQVFDGAGIVTSEAYDFKGNLLRSTRDLLSDYKGEVDWQQNPTPNDGAFTSSTIFDALNRPTAVTTPDNSVYRPTYNEANLLEKVSVNLRGATTSTPFVSNIDYNAKGQRTLVRYANGAETTYEHDAQTFRLIRLETTRSPGQNGMASALFESSATVQDLRYAYDPAGNITRIDDAALLTIFHNGEQVQPICDYTYDAIYRLIEARGREHIGQAALDFNPSSGQSRDYPFAGSGANPNDLQALRNYTERYEYDAVGNFDVMRHMATGGSWTRGYEYDATSLLDSNKKSNRLTRTIVGNGLNSSEKYTYADAQGHDVHGCMTAINGMTMTWDFEDQLRRVDLGGGGTACYVSDAAGQRVRKVIESHNGTRRKERIYLGGFEVYREYNSNGSVLALERETLHVMDGKQRIALVETQTVQNGNIVDDPVPLQRFQLSNHLGSSSLELDEDGALISCEEYHPYGTTAFQGTSGAAEVSLKRYRYTGKERDEETGLYYHGARYYAPWLGRWTSCDPLSIDGGLNVYAYANDQPSRFIDPTGRQPTCAPGRPGCLEEQIQAHQEKQELDPNAAMSAGKAFSEYDPTEPDSVIDARIANVSHPSQSTAASTPSEAEIDVVDVAKKAAFVGYLPLAISYILATQAAENVGHLARDAGMSEMDTAAANFTLSMLGPTDVEALGRGIAALGSEIRSMSGPLLADERGALRWPPGGGEAVGEALPAVSPQNESVLPRMSDRAIAQAHLNYENAKSWLSVAETEGANFQNWLTEHPTGWAMRGQALQEGLAASLETNPVTREMWLGIEQPPGKSVPDLLHIGEGAARPFADVFPLNPRQLAGHLKGRWYSPHIEPLVYPQPPPGWNPRVP